MIKHLFAAALIVGATAAANAQNEPSRQTQPTQQPSQQQQPSSQYNSREYTPIQSTDVPQSLRTTLQGDTYKGWESGKLYRRNNGEGYWLSTGAGSNAQNYYFDKNGKAVQRGATESDRSNSSGAGVGPGTGNDGTPGSGSGAGSGSDQGGTDKPKQ